ncbi:hypothetical protein [Actinomadura madurae]|uniref:hypothetical protein n=1 Tax=Actinomadura madurae TaxID=1993 RepID=UPI0020D24CAA|nr:hypothetical protein [Actinomadura madurae]MCP9983238.1 hypothetical protein [Actinomadura madurae]
MTEAPGPTARFAAVFARPAPEGARPVPPGIDPEEFRLALLEDTYEVVAGLELVTSALVLDPPDQPDAEAVTWPGTPILRESSPAGAFAALHALGAGAAALVAPDAPDLPPLLIGKLFRALGSAPAAACRAEGALPRGPLPGRPRSPPPAARMAGHRPAGRRPRHPRRAHPSPRRRPRPGLVPQGPAWHRLRTLDDLRLLDPGLEGWENTRALLEGHPLGR